MTSQDDPKAKMLLLLGEVGGLDEYDLIEALGVSERAAESRKSL